MCKYKFRTTRSITFGHLLTLKKWFMNNRARPGQAYEPTDVEHVANMVTHGLLILPSLFGLLWMLSLSANRLQYMAAFVYGCSLMILFSVSTTFHFLCYSGRFRMLKNFFHIGDRAVIYIFIASSYTPWLLLKSVGTIRLEMLYVVWVAATLGILFQYTYHEQCKWLETTIYLIVGVCPALVCIYAMDDYHGLYELALGGFTYIFGVIFFKCDGIIPFAHAIWHCFVFVGATFHFSAVCKYLLGPHNTISEIS